MLLLEKSLCVSTSTMESELFMALNTVTEVSTSMTGKSSLSRTLRKYKDLVVPSWVAQEVVSTRIKSLIT